MLRKFAKSFHDYKKYKHFTEDPIPRKYNMDDISILLGGTMCTLYSAIRWEVNSMIRDSEVWITSSGESFYQ